MKYLTHTLDDSLLRFAPLPDDFTLPSHIVTWSDEPDDAFTFIEHNVSNDTKIEGFAIVDDPSIIDDASYLAYERSCMMYEIISRYERDDNLVNELLTLF